MVISESVKAHVETIVNAMPHFYITSTILRDILAAWVTKTDDVSISNEDIINQLFIQTATWGLVYWENDYGVTPAVGASYETRRRNLFARITGEGIFNKRSARLLANVYSLAKTAVYMPRIGHYAFKTRHEVDDLMDFEDFKAAFEEMKPANTRHIIGLWIKRPMSPNMELSEYITQTKPGTLYLNGAFVLDGMWIMNGRNPNAEWLDFDTNETLTITKRSKATGEIIETWSEIT